MEVKWAKHQIARDWRQNIENFAKYHSIALNENSRN